MSNLILKRLLSEYSSKRNKEIALAREKKEQLYSNYPRLQEIDSELSFCALNTAKSILQTNNKSYLNRFNNKKQSLLNEKNEIYKSLNIDSNYLNPHFECSICQDTGYFIENNTTKMCNCLKQRIFDIEYNKINTINISQFNMKQFLLTKYSNTVNSTKYNSSISPYENIKIIQKISNNFIQNFNNPTEKNLLFIGNTGLGKTFLSTCIAGELLKMHKTVLYQTAPIMLDSIIDYKLGKNTDLNNIMHHLLSVDLLVIDDLGTENMTSMKFSELFTIINTRLLNQSNKITKTIISSNLSLEELSRIYGERIISRFIGNYNICYFFGDDIRLNRNHV